MGTLEMVEVDVGPLQPARVVRVLVEEGDAVRLGDTVAVLSTPTAQPGADQAAAQAVAAERAAAELAAGARPAELARAEAELRGAAAEAERAAAELARLEPLAARGTVSRSVLDAARAASRTTASRREALEAALALLREGARRERREAAAAQARGARAAAAGARAAAGELVLLAPVTGVVTSRNAEPGEVLGAGQAVVTLGDPARPWARVYLRPAALAQVRLGDSVVAMVEGDTVPARGRVAAIASQAEFTPRVALTEDERADLLLGVKVVFADSTGRLKAGLPVRVRLGAPRPASDGR